MGTIYASAIFTECDGVLLDDSKVRWTDAEKLRYLNAGQRQIVIFKPDAYVVNDVYRLVQGTKQRVPDGTTSFLNPSGSTLKEAIQLVKLTRNITVLSNLVASWKNNSYDTLTTSGANITSAICTLATDTAETAAIVLTTGHSYRLDCVLALTSGTAPTLTGTAGFPATVLAAGANTIEFTATAASMVITATNGAVGIWSCTFFLYDRTTYPSVSNDHLFSGEVIAPIGADFLDSWNPGWHYDTEAAAVKNYVFDDADPTRYYVTPPNTGAGYVEAIYAASPADLTALTGPPVSYDVAITLSDVYRDVLTNYVLFRCYAKDAALSPFNAQRAVEFWNLFVDGLGRKDLHKSTYSPNVKKPNPSTEG